MGSLVTGPIPLLPAAGVILLPLDLLNAHEESLNSKNSLHSHGLSC